MTMDLKSTIVSAFILGYVLSHNDTTSGNKLEKLFTSVGEKIAQYLTNNDLKNMAAIRVMADTANFELNRRFKVLYWRDDKIIPSFLSKALERIFQTNFTNDTHRSDFTKHHWTPYQAILFGDKNPLNVANVVQYCLVLVVIPYEDHLKIFEEIVFGKDGVFFSNKTKGSPTNGVIFPWPFSTAPNFGFYSLTLRDIDDDDENNVYQLFKLLDERLKLAIVINGNDQLTPKAVENRALRAAQTIRNDLGNMPICIVSQLDIRRNVEKYDNSSVLFFYGPDASASTFVVETKDEETMRKELLKWKEELDFLDSHQTIAFHFTMIEGNEPENSEQIFRDTFPEIQLSTLRLLGGPSIVGVNRQVKTEFRFDTGPVYSIIGFKKFGYGYYQEYFLCDSEYSSDESDN